MADAKEENKRSIQIMPGRMRLAEFERQDWVANAPEGATIDDVLEPGFWSLMSAQMKPYDRIEVRADDGTWLAQLMVLACDRTWARVHLFKIYKLTGNDVAVTQSARHEVFWRGPQHKWSIKRLADNEVIKSECQTRDEAAQWLRDHEKAM